MQRERRVEGARLAPFAFLEEELGSLLTALASKPRLGELVLKLIFAAQLKMLHQLTYVFDEVLLRS